MLMVFMFGLATGVVMTCLGFWGLIAAVKAEAASSSWVQPDDVEDAVRYRARHRA